MQRADSCEIQERRVREELARLGIPVGSVRVLRDEAVSGTDETRTGYQTLLQWCGERRISVLAVYDLSRLSRGKVKGLVEDIRFHGGRFIAVGDHIDTNQDGWELPLDFGQIHNAVSNKDTARRVRSGLENRMRDGNGSNGNFPYGYRSQYRDSNWAEMLAAHQRPKKDIVIFEPEAAIVRDIFKMYADGKLSLNRIARELHEKEAPFGIRGSTWNHRRIEEILRNEKYIGRWSWGSTETIRDSRGKKKQRPVDIDRITVADRPSLRIVDDSLWNRTQVRKREMREDYNIAGRPPVHPRHLYPKCNLSGLIQCGMCGRTLVLTTDRATMYKYLFCPAQRHGQCTQRRQFNILLAETALFDFLASVCVQWPEWLVAVRKEIERTVMDAGSQLPRQLEACQSKIAALGKQASNLLDKLASISGTSISLTDRLASLEQELIVLREREEKLKELSRIPSQLPNEAYIRSELARLSEVLSASSPATADMLRRVFSNIAAVEVRRPGRKRTHLLLRVSVSPSGFLLSALGSVWEQRLTAFDIGFARPSNDEAVQIDLPITKPGKHEMAAPKIEAMRGKGMGWEKIAKDVGITRTNCMKILRKYKQDLTEIAR
jgi:DNA invertase Pin-like site-specific DNA recombinase